MKKSLLLASTLAMALGVGVAVGARQARVQKAEALSTGDTVYLKAGSNWMNYSGKFALYIFGDGDTWVNMTRLYDDYYSAVIPTTKSYTSMIVVRSNPAKNPEVDHWGAKWSQTVDITFASAGANNLYTIPNDAGTGDDVSGSWSSFTPETMPDEDGYYIVGTKSSWSFTGATKLTTLNDDPSNYAKLEQYQAAKDEEFKVRKFVNYETQWFGIGNNGDNYVADSSKKVNVYASKDGKLYVSDYVAPDVPDEDGYYLVGSKTNNKYEGAPKMIQGNLRLFDNDAEYYNYSGTENETLKVRMYQADRPEGADVWGFFKEDAASVGIGTADENGNLKFSKDANIDIFANWEEETPGNWQINFTICAHADRFEVDVTNVLFDGKTKTGTEAGETQTATEGAVFTPKADLTKENYVFRGYYTDANCTTAYVPNDQHHAGFDLYAKFTRACYYLFGDATFLGEGHAWDVDAALPVAAGTGNNRLVGTAVIPNSASNEHPVKIKPLLWNGTMQAETYTLGETRTFVTIDGDGNFSFTEGGTYAFYVNNENQVWFNIGEYVFHAKFLTEVGGTCVYQGGTNIATLQGVWADQKAAYNALSEEDQNNIKEVGFDHGDEESSDDRLKMIAMYHYIVTKYGTAAFEDFIWGQKNIEPQVSVLYQAPIAETSNVPVFVIVAATITAISAGLFFILKKKHN